MSEETDGNPDRSRLLRLTRSGWLVAGALAITTVLWTAAHRDELASDALWPWRGPSQLVMLWSATLASLAILAVVRAQALEPLFGGLDAAVRLHRRLGLAALVLLGSHALLLVADALARGESVAAILIPSRCRVLARSTSSGSTFWPAWASSPMIDGCGTSAGSRCIASSACYSCLARCMPPSSPEQFTPTSRCAPGS